MIIECSKSLHTTEYTCTVRHSPDAVQNDSIWLEPDKFVFHSHIMEPGRLGIDYEGIWQPELVHKSAVQAQSFVGVVVRQTVVSPALVQKYCHGVFL